MIYLIRRTKKCNGEPTNYIWGYYDDVNAAFRVVEHQMSDKMKCKVPNCQWEMVVEDNVEGQ